MFIFRQKSNYPLFFNLAIVIFFGYIFYDLILYQNYWAFWIRSINIAIHEWGHIFFSFFWNQFLHVAWWTIMQLFIPIIIMIWFLKQRDFFWVSIMFAILWINLFDIAIYCADAQEWKLPLLMLFWEWHKYIHDRSYMLIELWILDKADEIWYAIWLSAIVCYMIFFIYSVILIINRFRY